MWDFEEQAIGPVDDSKQNNNKKTVYRHLHLNASYIQIYIYIVETSYIKIQVQFTDWDPVMKPYTM